MSYAICKRCGKMFKQNKNKYCEECFEINQREYALIREHIKQNPNATVMDIITEKKVSLKTIDILVEDGDVSYIENKLAVEDNTDTKSNNGSNRNRFHTRFRRNGEW